MHTQEHSIQFLYQQLHGAALPSGAAHIPLHGIEQDPLPIICSSYLCFYEFVPSHQHTMHKHMHIPETKDGHLHDNRVMYSGVANVIDKSSLSIK
jgi:hypothetical protein